MDWFFADWVRGTGIPHYHIEYSSKRSEKRLRYIKGKLMQRAAWASSFVAPVADLCQQWRPTWDAS